MTKFNVGDKVRILNVDAITFSDGHYYTGINEVVELFLDEYPKLRNQRGASGISIRDNEYHAIELITDKPKKSARITALESQVAALEAKVEALEKAGQAPKEHDTLATLYPLTAQFERESAEVDGILADIERKAKPTLDALLATYPPPVKSPNEQRADVIKRAKAFVAKKDSQYESNGLVSLEFVVNPEKRTVVAVIHGLFSKRIRNKAIAKCDPDDVFNADIGKAIALARALGVEVPVEFVKAVQPTEIVLGHRIFYTTKYPNILVIAHPSEPYSPEISLDLARAFASSNRILDDTDAVYS
jgi:hypothetical protein